MATNLEQKIGPRAHQLWEEEGQRSDREKEHWEQARRETERQNRPVGSTAPSGRSTDRHTGAAQEVMVSTPMDGKPPGKDCA